MSYDLILDNLRLKKISYATARTTLIGLGEAKSPKEAEEILSDNGFEKGVRGKRNFDDEIIEFMTQSPRTNSELVEYITTYGTANKARFYGLFDKIRLGINVVFASDLLVTQVFEEELSSKDMMDELKKLASSTLNKS